MSRISWIFLIFLRYYRNLGLRVSLYALLACLVTLASPFVVGFLPGKFTEMLDFSNVMPVLTILASSMLAVSTFSLNIMVTSHRAAADTTTPRMHRLLLENTTTQSVLATFIGAFVYSLASIILYQAGFYSEQAAIVVMGVTIVVVVLVVVSMLRWIQHLKDLGSVANSLHTATARARVSLATFAGDPALGGVRLAEDAQLPEGLTPLRAADAGYIQLIDVPGLQNALPEDTSIYVSYRPGTHVLKGEIIAQVAGYPDDETLKTAAAAFTLGDTRSYEQDAVFGLIVLSEIASKALSPGINDAGTAIGAIQNLKTLLWDFSRHEKKARNEFAETVFVAVPGNKTLVSSAFAAVARDGAGMIEVARSLRQALADLAASPDPEMAQAAEEMAATALEHCKNAALLDSEYEKLNRIIVPAPAMAKAP